MLATVAVTLIALFLSVVLTLGGWGVPLAVAHLAFALGIVPLIFAAMLHFVPVLTRTGDPESRVKRLPLWAQLAGLVAVVAMQGWLPRGWLHAAAAVDLIFVLILLVWISQRMRRCVGAPHPGTRWYGAALGALLLALLAVLAMPMIPDAWGPLRRLHLHLNTMGLVGLAALGTLPVLLPTALGKPDPQAAVWLRRRLRPAVAAILLLSAGAAISWPLAVPGAAIMLLLALGLSGQWARCFGPRTLVTDGVSASLLAAVLGLMLLLAAGTLHGMGLLAAQPVLLAWVVGFLLPLVTGALSQLLPVWRWPGPQIPARHAMRACLANGGVWRGSGFLIAAALLLAGANLAAALILGGALAIFVVNLARAMRVARSTR